MGGHRVTAGLIAALLVAIVAVLVVGSRSGGSRGAEAVALPAQVLVGPRVTSAQLAGRPAIVHFWASWCEPCRKEAPELARLAGMLHGRATLVGVDWSGERRDALAFVHRHGWAFPNLSDPGQAVGERDGVIGLPTTFILDAHGTVVQRLQGPQTAAGLLARLR